MSLKRFLIILVVVALALVCYNHFFCFSVEQKVSPVLSEGVEEYLPNGGGEVVRHKYYVLSFNSDHKQANWVYYVPRMKRSDGKVARTDNFREDKEVASGSAKPSDYTKTGYDRGHLCPAGDMNESTDAMSETFYMSNMSPQVPAFNRGIWKSLEEQVRKWGEREFVYVVTGPVFKNDKGRIGKSGVTVPGYYYKIVYSPSRKEMIGFVLANAKGRKNWVEHVVTVDSVESFTGIDFFPQLPDSLENRLEAGACLERWR